jgi:hypothetical protein
MKLTFINHASFLIENESGDKLITDPWNHGRVFNNSWELLNNEDELQHESQSALESANYIWISHEHPDHFHIPTLLSIPKEKRQNITVLFREEKKTNVKDALENFGFKVKLIPEKTVTKVAGFTFYTINKGHDTAAIISDGIHTLLNQNDCKLKTGQLEEIKVKYPNIDYYFYQFGMAGFYGNSDDKALFQQVREAKIASIRQAIDILKPKQYIPFASYIHFCKSANNYLNREQVTLTFLNKSLTDSEITFHIPTPLQEVTIKGIEQEENNNNAAYWDALFNQKANEKGRGITKDIICQAIEKYNESVIKQESRIPLTAKINNWINTNLKSKSNWSIIISSDTGLYHFIGSRKGTSKKISYTVEPLLLDASLHQKELTTYKAIAEDNEANYIVDGDLFVYAFEQLWGSDTFNISGCFYIKNGSRGQLISLFKQYYRI